MTKKTRQRSFDDVLALLGNQRFDVSAALEGANRRPGAVRVSKYGCAAVIMPSPKPEGRNPAPYAPASLVQKSGWVLQGEITRLLDRGYQKFLKSTRLEIPATADILRALHDFQLELDQATGEMALYNESLGTTSDVYLYDRVAGRPDQPKH